MGTRRMVPSFDALTPAGREAADKATREIDSWIDEKVDELSAELSDELKAAVDQLQLQVAEIQAELTKTRESIESLLGQLDTLKVDFDSGDGVTLDEAIEKTRNQMEAVRNEMKARETKWEGVGSGLVKQISSVIGKALPFPL